MLIRPIQGYLGVRGTLRNMHIVKMRSGKFSLGMKFCRVPDLLIFSTSVSVITLDNILSFSTTPCSTLQGIGRCDQTHDLPLKNFYEIPERKANCMLFLLNTEHLFK